MAGMIPFPGPALAMQFELDNAKDNAVVIVARGEIHQGDVRLFRQALAEVPPDRHLIGMLVDSPGGNLIEGESLAAQIRSSNVTVMIDSNSKCASACFLLFAASPHRMAGTNANIGVHSASIEGKETTDSMAMTLQMQRVAAYYGVPPAIIGKMAQTMPRSVEWLTHDDLLSMDVQIVDDIGQAQDSAPAPTLPVRPPALPAASRPPPPMTAVAEFQGALFCQQGTAKLGLRIVASSDSAHQRAMFSFGPMATSHQVPAGSFFVEGRIELAGGGIDLHPTEWVSQPSNFPMVGLLGQSDDGGKTFSGHATANSSCTVFTLKRTR
jgi:hypothetical protein